MNGKKLAQVLQFVIKAERNKLRLNVMNGWPLMQVTVNSSWKDVSQLFRCSLIYVDGQLVLTLKPLILVAT